MAQPEGRERSGGMSFIDLVSVIVWDYMWGMPLVLAILGWKEWKAKVNNL